MNYDSSLTLLGEQCVPCSGELKFVQTEMEDMWKDIRPLISLTVARIVKQIVNKLMVQYYSVRN